MEFAIRGIPIHTRSLSLTLRQGSPPEVEFAGYVIDLRKRSFVPVAGDLQGPGIIHHMLLEGAIDTGAMIVKRMASTMPVVAVEPTARNGGESCRDVVERPARLIGKPLDAGWARLLRKEMGGPLGCSHVLTLADLLGPTVRWALAEDQRLNGSTPERRANERIFRRDLTADFFAAGTDLQIALQLSDLHLRPTAEDAPATDRFAAQLEVRVAATLAMLEMRLTAVEIAERRRETHDFETATWLPRAERAAPLVGGSLQTGITATLLRQFAEPGRDQPLLDSLLMLAPATVQCFASFTDTWTQLPWAKTPVAETGGYPDSCYMWRRDGVVGRRRAAGIV